MTEIDMGNIVPKSPAEKQTQLHQADNLSKIILGEPLIRPTHTKPHEINHLIETDIGTINTQFPKRLEIYTALLRLQKSGRDLSAEEKTTLSFWLSTLNKLDTYIENHHLGARTLKEKQLTAFEKVRDSLERGNTLMTIVLPTGVGKTVLFAEIVEAMAGKKPDSESGKLQGDQLKTLVLVPTVDLVEQTKVRFSQFADTLTLSGKGHQSRLNADVTVMTYQELVAKVKSGKFDFSQYKLVIKDEEHHSRGPETSKAINTLSHAIQLGFTATPVDYEGLNIIHSMSVVEAVEDGLLADFKIRWVKTKFKLPKLNDLGRYDTSELNEKLNTTSRNRSVVQLHRERHLGTSAFAFCFSVDQVKALAAEFNRDGIVAAPVWGKMDEDLKKSLQSRQDAGEISEEEAQQLFYDNCYNTIRQKFEAGEIEVLCNVKALREGTDVARAKVCYRTAPGMSSVNAAQEAGRVLRLYNDEQAYIYEFIDQEDPNDLPPVSYAEIVGATEVQAHNAVKQSSDNGKEELAELLRELKEATETPQAETENSKLDTVVHATKPTHTIDVPDFEIIVDTQEILHIAQRNKARREGEVDAQGLHRINIYELASSYGVIADTVLRYLEVYMAIHTKNDINKIGRTYFVSDELNNLLEQKLQLIKEEKEKIWVDPTTGKSYATIGYFKQQGLQYRVPTLNAPIIKRIIKNSPVTFYDIDAVNKILEESGYFGRVSVDKVTGYYTFIRDDHVFHYGSITRISIDLGVSHQYIKSIVKQSKMKPIKGLSENGNDGDLYNKEDIMKVMEQKRGDTKIIVKPGSIYTSPDGETWGSINQIANILSVNKKAISLLIKENNVLAMEVLMSGAKSSIYNIETVKQLLIEKGKISDYTTDVNGVYTSESGDIFASVRGTLYLILQLPEATGIVINTKNVDDFIKRNNDKLRSFQGISPGKAGNKKALLYRFQDVKNLLYSQHFFSKRKSS